MEVTEEIRIEFDFPEIVEDEFKEIEIYFNKLSVNVNFHDRLTRICCAWCPYAYISLVLSDPFIQNIIFGVAGNAVWDGIKGVMSKFKKKKGQRRAGYFGVEIFEQNKIHLFFDLEIEDEKMFSESLDKLLEFIKENYKENAPKNEKTLQDNQYKHKSYKYNGKSWKSQKSLGQKFR